MLFALFQLNCTSPFYIREGENKHILEVDTIPTVYSRVLCLAMEDCTAASSNFCFDGCHQLLSPSPKLIKWDSSFSILNLEKRYQNETFTFFDAQLDNKVNNKSLIRVSLVDVDSLFSNISTTSYTAITIGESTNCGYKKIHFDGKYNYMLYEIDLDFILCGNRKIILPYFNRKKKKDWLYKEVECNVYRIINIRSIKEIKYEPPK
jgi:hypothetical protein